MANELPLAIQRKIDCYEPIETEGFVLYPFRVKDYYEYRIAMAALGFMAQTLPLKLMSTPILSAFYKMDYEKIANSEQPTMLFGSAIIGLALALRLNQSGDSTEEIQRKIAPFCDSEDPSILKCLKFTLNGEEKKTITPVQYASMRRIIAAQNGVKIHDELDNPDLVKAEEDIVSEKAPKLLFELSNLVSAAAAMTGKDESEIYEWPILKLKRRLSTFKRIFDYMVCGIGASQGTTWKGGNPCPNPWLDRANEWTGATMPIENFIGGKGVEAMQNAGALADFGEQ